MFVGVCELDVFIHASGSLKEKRFVVKSIKDRVIHKFNVSIAETDHLDKWQRAGLAVAVVTNEQSVIERTFSEIIKLIEAHGEAEVVRHSVQIY